MDNEKERDSMEHAKIKQKLDILNDYLIIPESIKPENLKLDNMKKKKSKRIFIFTKVVAVAASLAIILSSIFLINNMMRVREINPSIASKIKSYDELKDIYVIALNKTEQIASNIQRDSIFSAMQKESADASIQADTASDISYTNIQTRGVDEGDIVKTDGDYIYYLSNKNILVEEGNKEKEAQYKNIALINIVSTLRQGEMKKEGYLEIKGYPHEVYLKDKRLVIINQPEDLYLDLKTNKTISMDEYNKMAVAEGVNEEFFNRYKYQTRTEVLIYDVSDVKNPKLLREFIQEGYYSSSRLIGDNLYFVTNKNDYDIRYNTKEDVDINYIVPFTNDSKNGGKNEPIDLKNITLFKNPNSYSFFIVTGLNIKNDKEATTEACLGGSTNIYSSLDALYITNPEYEEETSNSKIASDMMIALAVKSTNIIKYTLEDGKPEAYAVGKVPGSILNQFSMDEYEGNFRVATTEGFQDDSKNNIYILNANLEIIGKVEGLAPKERVYSVRFMEDRGYIVTFKNIDPLFALDLSNPQEPKVLGQLKIPGFSSYLHPYSKDILIGIGNDTKTVKDSGGEINLTLGLKLSLFDVRDPMNPKEIQNYVIGDQGTYSEVLYNHKALLFSKEKDILAFPVYLMEIKDESIKDKPEGLFDNTVNTYIGYYVFSVDEVNGFTLKGSVTHYDKLPEYDFTDMKTYYDSIGFDIKRGIYIDNILYTISDKVIMASSLDDFSTISKIEF